MKVCHVITRMVVGGAQENTLFSARGLVEAGHECVLLTGPSPGPEGELLRQAESGRGLRIVECPFLTRELSPLNDWRAYRFLKKFFREERFDVVHTHSSKAGIVGRFAARAAKVPLVVHTIHGLAFHRFECAWKNALYVFAEKLAEKRCDRIYAVAQAMIEQSLAAGIGTRDKYQVVYSGMALNDFLSAVPDAALRASLGIPENAKVLGTVARLFPLKGYEDLFAVLPELLSAHPDLYVLLVGNGTMQEELKEQARAMGAEGRIVFAGLVPPNEVCRYVAQMDLLVHFSLREGLPRAAVQALACGKPVVAYNLDGTPEVVRTNETGFLLEPGDLPGISTSVATLLSDDLLRNRMGKNGQTLVRALFDWQKMSSILIAEYSRHLSLALNE